MGQRSDVQRPARREPSTTFPRRRPRSLGRTVTAPTLLGFLSAQCGQILGLDEYRAHARPAEDAAPARFTVFASATCGDCIQRTCPDRFSACEDEATCKQFAECHFGCAAAQAPDSCLYQCYADLGRKTPAAAELLDCSFGSCQHDCYDCGAIYVWAGPDCGACIAADDQPGGACDLIDNWCVNDPGCHQYRTCLARECKQAAPDPQCRMICNRLDPEGATASYEKLGVRFAGACKTECAYGEHWECQMPPVWPPESPGQFAHVTLHVRGLSLDAGSPGFVRVCHVWDEKCAPEVDRREIDSTGTVAFDLPHVKDLSANGYLFDIALAAPDPALPHLLYVPNIPIVADTVFFIPSARTNIQALLGIALGTRGDALDPEKGLVCVSVLDCVGGGAGASVSVSLAPPSSTVFHGFDFAQPDGQPVWFPNLDVGMKTVTAQRGGKMIGDSVAVPVRAGAVTLVVFNYGQG